MNIFLKKTCGRLNGNHSHNDALHADDSHVLASSYWASILTLGSPHVAVDLHITVFSSINRFYDDTRTANQPLGIALAMVGFGLQGMEQPRTEQIDAGNSGNGKNQYLSPKRKRKQRENQRHQGTNGQTSEKEIAKTQFENEQDSGYNEPYQPIMSHEVIKPN